MTNKKSKTLAEQFKDDITEALWFIVHNRCKLEHRVNIDSDDWQPITLREMLRGGLLNKGFRNKEKANFHNWFMTFYRIKTQPTERELEEILTEK